MNRPVHFEILADHPERAVEFYSAVFGWEFQKWERPLEYWLITTGPEAGLKVRRNGGEEVSPGTDPRKSGEPRRTAGYQMDRAARRAARSSERSAA